MIQNGCNAKSERGCYWVTLTSCKLQCVFRFRQTNSVHSNETLMSFPRNKISLVLLTWRRDVYDARLRRWQSGQFSPKFNSLRICLSQRIRYLVR